MDNVEAETPKETFDNEFSKLGDEFKLYKGLKWTIWEQIDFEGKKVEWSKQDRKVAWFDNIITFHQVWNRLPHANLLNVLFDGSVSQFKV